MRNERRTEDVPEIMTPADMTERHRPAAHLLPVLALSLTLVLGPLLAGCGSEAEDPGANVSDVPTSTSPTPAEDPTVAAAIADLAKRQGVKAEEITVVSHDKVTWRDSSLGCPEPGKMYAMVLTDGVRVVLEAGEQTYEYHGGESGPVTFCENPQDPAPDKGSSDAPQ